MKTLAAETGIAEIRTRFGAVTENDARQWGSMSLADMLCHVGESYRLMSRDTPWAPVRIPFPRSLVKVGALWLPFRWPHGVPTLPELNPERLHPAPTLESGRQSLLEAFDRFVAERDNRRDHPIFGAMKPADWMRWGYLHADHHLRQFGR